MESLESLREQLRQAQQDLAKITIKKQGTVPWAPGVQDQYKTENYSYNEYKNPQEAYRLQRLIQKLEKDISTYHIRLYEEDIRQKEIEESRKKYNYTADGELIKTANPAMAARYNAQQRFLGMNKLQQTMNKLSGQQKRFKELWNKAMTTDPKTQQQVADELNKMFRR